MIHLLSHLGEAGIFGVIQGLAEFLPISSSGHLLFLHHIIHINAVNEQTFDVALHIGTLLALIVYFWRDIKTLVIAAVDWLKRRPKNPTADQKLVGWLIIASVPGAVLGALFESFFESTVRTPVLVAIMLMAAGGLLWLADKYVRDQKPMESLTWLKSLIIGLGQAIALIPGVSRSGASITMSRLVGLSREAAARFSFLMAIPITAGAALFKMLDLGQARLSGQDAIDMLVGVAVAGVVGWVAIRVLLRYVSRHSYSVFAWYRLGLGLIVLIITILY